MLVLRTSGTAEMALDYAVEKAAEKGSTLVALYILEQGLTNEVFDTFTDIGFIGDRPSEEITESLMREYRQRGYEELGRVQVKAMEAGVPFEPLMIQGEYVSEVLNAIERFEVSLAVLVKRKKKAFVKYFSKSHVEEVKQNAPCEVVVFTEE